MIKRIGNNIVLLKLSDSDSNIYIIDDVAVDSGTGFNFSRLYTLLKVLKKSVADIKQVINTHGHFDHIGGNGYFINAKVAIHENDADIIETGDIERSVADFFDGKLKPRTVDMKLKEGDVLNIGGMELEVIHTPGHTPGSICLYNRKDGILFTGDTIFANGVGRTDLPGGDPNALRESIEKLKKLDVKIILPGHGEPVLENAKNVIENAAEMADYM